MGEYKKEVMPCERCGVATYSSDRVFGQNGKVYCSECASKLGLANAAATVKNVCAICGRVMRKDEVKMVLPSKSFGEISIPLENRLACVSCYSTMTTRTKVLSLTKYKSRKASAKLHLAVARKELVQQMI